jgi:hypothetical protein
MRDHPLELADFIREHDLGAEIVAPGVPMPTVDAAAAAMRVAPGQIFRSADIIRLNDPTVHDVILDRGVSS